MSFFIVKTICIGGCVLMFSWLYNLCKPSVPVETAEEALIIGKGVIDKKFPECDYSRRNLAVCFDERKNEWIVSAHLKQPENAMLFCGAGPIVHIKKSNGRITYERPGK